MNWLCEIKLQLEKEEARGSTQHSFIFPSVLGEVWHVGVGAPLDTNKWNELLCVCVCVFNIHSLILCTRITFNIVKIATLNGFYNPYACVSLWSLFISSRRFVLFVIQRGHIKTDFSHPFVLGVIQFLHRFYCSNLSHRMDSFLSQESTHQYVEMYSHTHLHNEQCGLLTVHTVEVHNFFFIIFPCIFLLCYCIRPYNIRPFEIHTLACFYRDCLGKRLNAW